ncbi:DUF6474 family protein [Corynebacterium stationis]|uniref:DUF6474 family protein n=1 Tax=Corynebacterium stationis TaxID=1705 RepID=UPI00263B27F0|nr:DUF6474 family protein [Corynebacterium stationis]
MSLLKKFRKSRRAAKAELKAAKTKAKAEVKSADKARKRQQKLLANQEKQLLKSEEKGLKQRRKHELKLAKTELEKLRAGRFNTDNVKRYAGAARTATPLLLPLLYRAIVSGRQQFEQSRAKKAGVTTDQLASFAGHGASIKARTQGIRNTLDENGSLPAGFKRDIKERLDDLDAAVDNAELMTPQQRRRAHSSINREIDMVTQEIQDRITRG